MSERGGAYVASTASLTGDVRLAPGANIWFGAVLRGDMAPIVIGESTNVQDLCVLHCDPDKDLVVGPNVTVGHGAILHCRRIGAACLIGMGSILLADAEIGEESLIGAGALVREGQKIPPRSIVVGVPGKVIGRTSDAQVADFVDRARRYLEWARRHAAGEFASPER
jgi:carbonic anhydrase/acetyltransferase-like protein (isoleucine patch superfamily)